MESRVLYVTGQPDDARDLSGMLEPLRFRVDCAGSVEQARRRLLDTEYDVVLTEAQLPDGKWLDVLHLVRDSSHEPAVIVTGRNMDARFHAEALNLGAHALLPQPFSSTEVQHIFSNAFTRYMCAATL
jgi:DNA-binding response OmpR family regulator